MNDGEILSPNFQNSNNFNSTVIPSKSVLEESNDVLFSSSLISNLDKNAIKTTGTCTDSQNTQYHYNHSNTTTNTINSKILDKQQQHQQVTLQQTLKNNNSVQKSQSTVGSLNYSKMFEKLL